MMNEVSDNPIKYHGNPYVNSSFHGGNNANKDDTNDNHDDDKNSKNNALVQMMNAVWQ